MKGTTIDFKRDLRALLEKYEVSIGAVMSDSSDTHGINDERISICDTFHGKEIERLTEYSFHLSAYDLKE